jgi:hypothetical protein
MSPTNGLSIIRYHVDSNKIMGSIMYSGPERNVFKINISFQFFPSDSDEYNAALNKNGFLIAEFKRTANFSGALLKGMILIL